MNRIERLEKVLNKTSGNPYHDSKGKFTFSPSSFKNTSGKDAEVTDNPRDWYLTDSSRKNINKVPEISSTKELKDYLSSNGIKSDIDNPSIKKHEDYENIEFDALKKQASGIVASIEFCKAVFGKESLSKLKEVKFYSSEAETTGSFDVMLKGEKPSKTNGTLELSTDITNRGILHEFIHVVQDSTKRKSQDCVSWSKEILDKTGVNSKAYTCANKNHLPAEQLADLISFGIANGRNLEDVSKVINYIKKNKTENSIQLNGGPGSGNHNPGQGRGVGKPAKGFSSPTVIYTGDDIKLEKDGVILEGTLQYKDGKFYLLTDKGKGNLIEISKDDIRKSIVSKSAKEKQKELLESKGIKHKTPKERRTPEQKHLISELDKIGLLKDKEFGAWCMKYADEKTLDDIYTTLKEAENLGLDISSIQLGKIRSGQTWGRAYYRTDGNFKLALSGQIYDRNPIQEMKIKECREGFHTDNSIKAVVRHETGHIISYQNAQRSFNEKDNPKNIWQLDDKIDSYCGKVVSEAMGYSYFSFGETLKDLKKCSNSEISEYGRTNFKEAIAESWSNPNYSLFTKKVSDILKKDLKKPRENSIMNERTEEIPICSGYGPEFEDFEYDTSTEKVKTSKNSLKIDNYLRNNLSAKSYFRSQRLSAILNKVNRGNPYHDEKGRFSSSHGQGSGIGKSGKENNATKIYEKYKDRKNPKPKSLSDEERELRVRTIINNAERMGINLDNIKKDDAYKIMKFIGWEGNEIGTVSTEFGLEKISDKEIKDDDYISFNGADSKDGFDALRDGGYRSKIIDENDGPGIYTSQYYDVALEYSKGKGEIPHEERITAIKINNSNIISRDDVNKKLRNSNRNFLRNLPDSAVAALAGYDAMWTGEGDKEILILKPSSAEIIELDEE